MFEHLPLEHLPISVAKDQPFNLFWKIRKGDFLFPTKPVMAYDATCKTQEEYLLSLYRIPTNTPVFVSRVFDTTNHFSLSSSVRDILASSPIPIESRDASESSSLPHERLWFTRTESGEYSRFCLALIVPGLFVPGNFSYRLMLAFFDDKEKFPFDPFCRCPSESMARNLFALFLDRRITS